MSVSSLPIFPVNPAPATAPSSDPLPSAVPGAGAADGGDSFGAHLHHARNPPADPPARTHADASAGKANNTAQGDTSSSTSPDGTSSSSTQKTAASSPSADAATSGDAADQQASQASDDSANSLASAVLGLIGQSTANGADTGAASSGDAKASDDKPAAPVAATPIPTPAPLAVAAVAPVPAPIVPAPPTAPASTGKASAAVQGAGKSGANAATGGLAAQLPKASASTDISGTASSDDDEGDDSSDNAALAGDVSLLAQGAGNAAGLGLGSLPATASATAPAVVSQPAAGATPPQDAAELAALRGVVGAAAPALPATAGTGHALTLATPANAPGFAQELGQQVAWLGGQDVKQAQIRLNPQELGQLDVKVSVEHGRVDVVFTAQHPEAVTAVQQSLGQLNHMLGGQGLSLGQAMVSQQQTTQQQFGSGSGQAGHARAESNDDESLDPLGAVAATPVALGLVDTFA